VLLSAVTQLFNRL